MSNSISITEGTEDLFIRLQYKLRLSLKNNGNWLLGTDVLRTDKRSQLFKIVALNIETKFLTLLKSDFKYFDERTILFALIKMSTEDFLVQCYSLNFHLNKKIFSRSLYLQFLLENSNILIRLPFSSVLKLETENFYSIFDPIYSQASDKFLEALFDNLIVEISHCVMQIIITEFSFINHIRQILYKSNFLSLRNIERFKNNLVWQTRLKYYINYPKNLYNSQYGIWVIRSTGIYYRTIYANRSEKLLTLRKTALLTITLIELQDFLISRVDEFFYLVGDRLRYTVTTVFGQFVGLFWRGIIEGLKK
jgi:hypothetical protein